VSAAVQSVSQARANLVASRGGVAEAQAARVQIEAARRQYGASQAAIGQAQAAANEAQLALSYTNIYAPTSGIVGRRNVEAGQRLQPGQALMAVVETTPWISANFKETQLEHVRPGQPVTIKLDTFPHRTFLGHVTGVSPASGAQFALLPQENATGNFTKVVQRIPVKIEFDPRSIKSYETRILPGMSAVVGIVIK
jgi:membrane fusion protein (multidrug efflux system)